MNDITTEWAYRDVITVVEGAGTELDALVLPKVTSAHDVQWLDTLLTQIERAVGLPSAYRCRGPDRGRQGLVNVDAIAAASPRVETSSTVRPTSWPPST